MRKFGLIGKTLKHSFSPGYFAKKFSEQGITDCSYDNFELPTIGDLNHLLATPGLEGFNITIPYKEEVLPFLHSKDKLVEKIQACNCVHIIDGQLHGYNTDAPAFRQALQTKLAPHHKCAIILGSGGASKAVRYALEELGIDYVVVSRHKGQEQLGYEDVGTETIEHHQIIINTTPLGMYPNINEDPPIPYEAISGQHLLFDLTYNPEKTKFLQQGESRGAQILNGYNMLVLQAEESWKIWNAK